ncbi:MAG: aldose 1-epimerase family protein, partial [Nocardioides sp.]
MLPPSGDQYEIRGGGYRAVVTESGAALRLLEHAGRPLLDGFAEDERSPGGRGQVLVPWPNRLRDGAYTFAGRDQQLALTEPALHNASHGLVRWVAWSLEEHTAHSVSLTYRLMAQTGYPWTLDLHLVYDLSADGLTVSRTATNMSAEAAPYAAGAHPSLAVGDGIDHLELTLPAATRSLVDDRLLPVGREPVEGTAYDFRVARPLRGTGFNDAFTDLERDEDGLATTVLRDPRTGQGVALWVDRAHPWLQVYSADDVPGTARRSLAVEPMTAQADAFRSGEDLLVLA